MFFASATYWPNGVNKKKLLKNTKKPKKKMERIGKQQIKIFTLSERDGSHSLGTGTGHKYFGGSGMGQE